jgi:tRNA modification GTPase
LAGELARRVRPILDQIAETLALVEVGIDFSEEEVSFLSADDLNERIGRAVEQMDHLRNQSQRMEALSHEPVVVLVGRPNAGKSTLINALAGHERSVVSHQAGTTRDVLWTPIVLKRGIVRMADVAGLQTAPSGQTPGAAIEQAMQRRAAEAIESADVILLVQSTDDTQPPVSLTRPIDLIIQTKADLKGEEPLGPIESASPSTPAGPIALPDLPGRVVVSVHRSWGMETLGDRLDVICFGQTDRGTFALNTRHLQHLADADAALSRAASAIGHGPEVVAMELREALDQLGAIVGSISPDELLGLVFSKFCIGK